MNLACFLQDLLEEGKVTVAGQIIEFSDEDLQETTAVLKRFYDEDVLDMPLSAPGFSDEAAIWGARYLYHAIQLSVLRDLDDSVVLSLLQDYSKEKEPEAIYSVDLSLRYLPDLVGLAKGLAPDDVLVKCLLNTALQWPFSSVGIELTGEPDCASILAHSSLKQAYVDRIIEAKDKQRAAQEEIVELINQALGNYTKDLWPGFKKLKEAKTTTNEDESLK